MLRRSSERVAILLHAFSKKLSIIHLVILLYISMDPYILLYILLFITLYFFS